MRFGGHETFAIRADWMPKGLKLVHGEPQAFAAPLVSDRLGVGRNMAKSIRHWLGTTGLVCTPNGRGSTTITEIGELILKNDPYFLKKGTWWALHINLATDAKSALVWHWFFNRLVRDRFDREGCFGDLKRWLVSETTRPASPSTIARDISCLLGCYAVKVPPEEVDPEDGTESPLRSLDLVMHMGETDNYQLNRRKKDIPSAIVGYAFAALKGSKSNKGHTDVPLPVALSEINSPGRTLVLEMEAFNETLATAEEELGQRLLQTQILGAERSVRVKNMSPVAWLKQYYEDADS